MGMRVAPIRSHNHPHPPCSEAPPAPPTPQIQSTLFSAATRLRRIFLLLPQALAAVQPGSAAAVAAHFACHERTWELSAPTAVHLNEGEDRHKDAVQLLRSKLPELATAQQLAPGPAAAVARSATPSNGQPASDLSSASPSERCNSVLARLKARWLAFLDALNRRTGVTSHHLALAVQVRLCCAALHACRCAVGCYRNCSLRCH